MNVYCPSCDQEIDAENMVQGERCYGTTRGGSRCEGSWFCEDDEQLHDDYRDCSLYEPRTLEERFAEKARR